MVIDKNIIIRMKAGDESAFDSIFWTYNPKIYNFAKSLLFDNSLAEDITQTLFLKIWECRDLIDPEQNFDAYIYTIAKNLVNKEGLRFSKSQLTIMNMAANLTEWNTLPEEGIDAASLEKYIFALIDELPASRRKIFLMSRQQYLSNKEIAAHLAISEKTVETQISRSISFLRKRLHENNV